MKFLVQPDGSLVVTFAPEENKLAIEFLASLEMPNEEEQDKIRQVVMLLGVNYRTMIQ